MFCLALRPGLKRFRDEFEGGGVEAFGYMDDVSLGLMGATANAIRAFAFLRPLPLWLTPPRPWHYHRKGMPRRRRILRSLKALMFAL